MIPTFELGPLVFPAYFTLLTVGFMLAIWLAWREAPGVGVDQNQMLDLSLIALVMGIVGSRLLHVVADGYLQDYINLCVDPFALEGKRLPHGWQCSMDYVCQAWNRGELCNVDTGLCHPGRDCLRAVKFWYGGLAYYGGFVAAFAACMWFIVRKGMRVWRVADLTGFGIALGLVFGRIGCLLAGCCFGGVCHSWQGMAFPKGSPAWRQHIDAAEAIRKFVHGTGSPRDGFWGDIAQNVDITRAAEHSLAVYPTQLYSILANAAVFGFTYWLFKTRRRYDGQVFAWFMLLYGISRSVIEYWRNDARGVWFGETISTSQLISIPFVVLALYLMWRGNRGKMPSAT